MHHSDLTTAVLFGSGNVATHLGRVLAASGINWLQVYSRNLHNAGTLASQLSAQPIDDPSLADTSADLWLIAVSDDAIAPLAGLLPSFKGIVAHTAGSVSMDVLSKFIHAGVLYPVQTFSKETKPDPANIPLLIEGSDKETTQRLMALAGFISDQVLEAGSRQRELLHLTAVLSCNFVNHLYAISSSILEQEALSFDLLRPLIEETTRKALSMPPYLAQTGPAVRNDRIVLSKHLEMLASNSHYKAIYKAITDHILKFYGHI